MKPVRVYLEEDSAVFGGTETTGKTTKAVQIFYEGRVQGVGFRWTVKNIARGYEVSGWIRNLADSRVELQAASEDEEELEAFLTAIRESALAGNIRKENRHPLDASSKNFRGFEIVP